MREYDLVCLGSGPAGEKAATQAAYFGHRVAVVERAPRPGGAMVNTGTIPSKALRETSLLCSSLRRRPIPGLSLETRHLSIPRLMARKNLVEIQEHDRIEASFDRHDITIHRGHGRIVDPHTVSVQTMDGGTEQLRTKFILIATGSAPLRPSHIAFHAPAVVDADGVLEIDRLPETMVVVGGGVIGCEYACVFAELGVAVTLIEPRGSLLPFVDADCLDNLMTAMQEMDINVRLNTKVVSAQTGPDGRAEVQLESHPPIRCDVLLWAAGRKPNTDDIGLDKVGLIANERGCLAVNGSYQTTVPSIYAAGDVVGHPALASTSMEQGRIAACHMFGIDFKKKLAEMFPLGLYTIPPIAMVGLSEAEAVKKGHAVVVGRAPYRNNARGRMLGDEQGLLKLVFDRATRRVLGAVIIGESATDLIHFGQAMMFADATIDDFVQTCFTYPSLGELYKYAAYSALQALATERHADKPPVARPKAA